MISRPIHDFTALAGWGEHDDSACFPRIISGQEFSSNNSAERMGDEMHRLITRDFSHLFAHLGDELFDRLAG
jgi:hypothetical protein